MVYNEKLKREIPEGWAVDVIENIIQKGKSTKKISASNILISGTIPVIDQSTKYICGFTNDDDALIRITTPRIIFGDHTRILKLINFDFARGADGTQVLLSSSVRLPQILFYHSLLMIDLSNYGYARHYKFLKQAKIILPVTAVSRNFERIVSKGFDMIRDNVFQNQQLAELRDWLLPMLMNGQVTVK